MTRLEKRLPNDISKKSIVEVSGGWLGGFMARGGGGEDSELIILMGKNLGAGRVIMGLGRGKSDEAHAETQREEG